jgi:nucleotide-binding universal stress UspA family protein
MIRKGVYMYKKILVTLDGSELSECVFPHVDAFRKGFPECEVILLQVVEPLYDMVVTYADAISPEQWKAKEEAIKKAARNYLKNATERFDRGGGSVRAEVISGRVEESIAGFVEDQKIDVIIMATHGRSGVSRWVMGSVADRVLRSSRIPVLMVRAPGTKGGT